MQGAIGSSYFLGWSLLCTFIPQLADQMGRKPVVVITFTVTTLAILATLYNNSLKIHLALSFTMGLFASGRIAVSFIWLMEMLTP
jgi:MFS family permease